MTSNITAKKVENLRALIETVDPKELETILEQSQGFADSQVQTARDSEKKAWRVAGAFGGISLLLGGALIGLTPLKTVVPPKVLLVDKQLATATELQTLEEARVPIEEAVTRKAVNDFILARENYTFDTAELNYYSAAAFMSPQLQTQWAAFWDLGNEKSPLNVYKKDVKVKVVIKSITPKAVGDVATVNFDKYMKQGENDWGTPVSYIATVTYKYVNAPTEEKIRRINPFGFQITDYRTDPLIGGTSPVKPAPVQAQAPATYQAPVHGELVAPQVTAPVVRRDAQ